MKAGGESGFNHAKVEVVGIAGVMCIKTNGSWLLSIFSLYWH